MTFEMTKPVLSTDIIIYVVSVFVIILGIFIFILMLSSKNYSLEVNDQHITIKSLFYNSNLLISDIDIKKIAKINLNNSDIKIHIRLNGIGLPGLLIGWFSSSEGKLKLYVTDKNEVLYLPTKQNYTILFSTKNADEIINTIKKL